MMILSLVLAVITDRILGEMQRFHPLALFGSFANRVEAILNKKRFSSRLQKIFGFLGFFICVAPLVAVIVIVDIYSGSYRWVLDWWVVYFCIGHQSLKLHVMNIYHALADQDIELARQKVGLIVSRDTKELEPGQIRKAAIESALENGADAVFSSIFWFVLLGAPGVILHRLANTLDAMWGYRNERFVSFGFFAAKFDDLLNYIPARLTALTYSMLGCCGQAVKSWRYDASLLSSPNGGPVMCAGAGALGVRLGGQAVYHGKSVNKPEFGGDNEPENLDIKRAVNLVQKALIVWVFVIIIIGMVQYVI